MTNDYKTARPKNNQTDLYEPLGKLLPVAEQLQGLLLFGARREILRILKKNHVKSVLDVCCGSGCLGCRLTLGGFKVTGIDSSPTMLNRARKKRRVENAILCDAMELPFTQTFDAAVISLALHEMDPHTRDIVWQKMRNSVKIGGLLIVLDFTIPEKKRWHTRSFGGFIDKDERQMGRVNPLHYSHYQEFMASGGLKRWLQSREQPNIEYCYAGGNLGLFSVINTPQNMNN